MKTSTTDEEKRRLQGRVEWVEREIQGYKGEVSEWESRATGCEERLGLLKKEGECRTRQCSCE
jgi:chromosome segregation ATPase